MTYVVTEDCIKCKFTDCVEVCPVDCFYEGENMLVINPDECPAEAILPDSDSGAEKWIDLNATQSNIWPNLTEKKEQSSDAEEYQGVENKFEKFYSDKPGE